MARTKVPVGFAKVVSRIHKVFYKLTAGKIGAKIGDGGIIVLLKTTGRKSGKQRETPLLTTEHKGDYLLIASFSGHDFHPNWYLNLKANSEAELLIGKSSHKVTATFAGDDERADLYKVMAGVYSDYDEYQKVTDRVIPVVKLTPVTS